RPEIVATSPRGVAAYRLSGERLWALDDAGVVAWQLTDLGEGGPSLVTVHADGALALHGRHDPGNSIRSNASGIGTRVAARIAGRWVVDQTLRNSSGPGQSLAPVSIGTGGAAIDYVRIDWS